VFRVWGGWCRVQLNFRGQHAPPAENTTPDLSAGCPKVNPSKSCSIVGMCSNFGRMISVWSNASMCLYIGGSSDVCTLPCCCPTGCPKVIPSRSCRHQSRGRQTAPITPSKMAPITPSKAFACHCRATREHLERFYLRILVYLVIYDSGLVP